MKKNPYNIKYFIFSIAIIATFAMAKQANADSYVYRCADQNIITSNVNINPSGPFTTNAGTQFYAAGQITSQCTSSRTVRMTAQNKDKATEPIATLIPQQTLDPGIPLSNNIIFNAAMPKGGYGVEFLTWVDEPQILEHYASFTPQDVTPTNLGHLWATIAASCASCASSQGIPNSYISLDTKNVKIDQLPGFTLTSLNNHGDGYIKNNNQYLSGAGIFDNNEHIWTVAQDGTYAITISADGYFSTYIEPRSNQQMEVSFYLKVNNNEIPLAAPQTAGCTNYSRFSLLNPKSQFVLYGPCSGGTSDGHTYRKTTTTQNYSFLFQKTMNLNAGDTVYLYATATGEGARNAGVGNVGGWSDSQLYDMGFEFINRNTALDVIKLP